MLRTPTMLMGCCCVVLIGCSQPTASRVETTLVSETSPTAVNEDKSAEKLTAPEVDVVSCAASGCHGGSLAGEANWKNAATRWQIIDPHRRAFVVLYTARAIEMVKRLEEWPTDKAPEDQAYLKVLEQRCTGCHAVNDSHEPASKAEQYVMGVTCTGCHGEASKWGHAHYYVDWRDEQGRLKAGPQTEGFHDLRSLSDRAAACMQCHIGPGKGLNGDHDMNHDLIAAGHPRLNFEFSAYLANLPKHWDDKADQSRHFQATKVDDAKDETFQFDAWLVGHQAAGKQHAHLSKLRKDAGPWPEFSEFDCYKCHHSFASAMFQVDDEQWQNWRQLQFQPLTAEQKQISYPQSAELPAPQFAQPTTQPGNLPLANRAAQKKVVAQLFAAEHPSFFDQALHAQLALDAWLADLPASEQTKLREHATKLRTVLQACFPTHEKADVYDAPSQFVPSQAELAETWHAIREQLTEMNP